MSNGKGKQPVCEPIYIATGCNRFSNVADVRERDGLVAFGAGRLVALWNSEDPSHRGVHQTLPGHIGDVVAVKFLRSEDSKLHCSAFVTGDTAGKVNIWHEDPERGFVRATGLELPGQISSLACIEAELGRFVLAFGTSASEVYIYQYCFNGELQQIQHNFPAGSKIPLSMALTRFSEHNLIMLAVGTTESKIHILAQYYRDQSLLAGAASTSIAGFRGNKMLPRFDYRQTLGGHADWVRSLDFTAPLSLSRSAEEASDYKTGDVLLASGSQDTYTRIWRVTTAPLRHGMSASAAPSALDELDRLMESEIDAKRFSFAHGGVEVSIHAESVLLGHENWVTDVHWHTPPQEIPQLLTASADRSMMMWTLDASTKIWLSSSRFGEIGGTNLGFFGALWGKEANTLLAHGWGGSFHVWHRDNAEAPWKSRLSIAGHYDKVASLAWEPEGQYLISGSKDQTARLHGPWRRDGVTTWHELARPQIHGYDIEDVAFLSRLRYISGSEEKIVRVFDAPAMFIESMKQLGTDDNLQDDGQRPNAAAVPALGLSNKAVFESNDQGESAQASITSSIPPLEETLLTSTLWPETEKLYGHGYEINAIAASHDGRLIASACRSNTPEHAVVRLHRTSNWTQIMPPLAGHSLTVTAIRFSPDNRFILTASRDRSWQLYERSEDGETYHPKASAAKAHARIIWDCAWADDGTFFATAARDKQVKIWQPSEEAASAWKPVASLALPEAATAVACTRAGNTHVLAIGTEAGHIHIYTSDASASTWNLAHKADSRVAHCSVIRSLSWQPKKRESVDELLLASASDDRSTRVLRIVL